MSFNTGGTGYLDFGDVYDFAGDAGGSWELWFQPAMATVSYDRLLSHEVLDGGTNSREGWDLLWSGTAFQFERWRGTLHDIVGVPSNQIDAGVTYHVVVTYDGTTLSMFLDGQLLASQPAALQLRPPGTPFRIGMASFGNNPFYGTVDEAAIYSRALTPAEVWQHYDAGLR
jgi:hypothetical protein